MSTAYRCRFNQLVLDLAERPDIVSWLVACEGIKIAADNGNYDLNNNYAPEGITAGGRCDPLFHNEHDDNTELELNITDVSKVYIDYCVGNANKAREMEEVIYLFAKYYISGTVIMDEDDDIYRLYNMQVIKDNINLISLDEFKSYYHPMFNKLPLFTIHSYDDDKVDNFYY